MSINVVYIAHLPQHCEWGRYHLYIKCIFYMKKITILLITSLLFGQYDYSLEDINPTSEYYGNNVGTSFFEGNITLHYFGHFN